MAKVSACKRMRGRRADVSKMSTSPFVIVLSWLVASVFFVSSPFATVSSFQIHSPPRRPHHQDVSQRNARIRDSIPPLLATKRRGAMQRKKSGFDAPTDDTSKPENEDNSVGKIYSLPALYDLAFGYRNYDEEVDFLLWAHEQYSSTFHRKPLKVLELAAGPARHCLTALSLQDSPVQSATALDLSPDMVDYAMQLAAEELNDEKSKAFHYICEDMREFNSTETFDTAWILLGSLQHLTTNDDVISCFQSAHNALVTGGTLVLELPHPRETFSMVECTRNGWEVPLEDDAGKEYGELQIVWGDDNDVFDPIQQVRQFTVSMVLTGDNEVAGGEQRVKEVVPMRLFTAQEIDALARCSGFEVVATYGALADVPISDEDEAFRLVCVLRKIS